MSIIITKETFGKITNTNAKLDVLFDLLSSPDRKCDSLIKLEDEVDGLQIRAARWGGIGGVIAAIGAYLASLFISNIGK